MQNATIRLTGTSAMLMHSDRLANPVDPATIKHQELTKSRTKTPEVHEAIMHSQFINSLYLDDNEKIVMPAQNIRKCLIEGARFHKRGKDVERGVIFLSEYVPLEYDGPKAPEKLWEKKAFRDIRSVVIQRRRVMTCRPRFNDWACQIDIAFDPSLIDQNDLTVALTKAGDIVGIGDYRPLFGRFHGELI